MEIGKVYLCPSCGWVLKKEGASCGVCGAAPGVQGEAPRLDENALAARLRSTRQAAALCKALLPVLGIAALVAYAMARWEAFVSGLLGAVICALLSLHLAAKLKHLVAVNIVRDALGEVFNMETYRPNQSIPPAMIAEADLVYRWNECGGSDYVRGEYRGVPFAFSHVKLENIQENTDADAGIVTPGITQFRGQWIVLGTKRAVEHPLRLRERERKPGGNYKPSVSDVETENIAFNETFQILTQDPHTAFYMLTPHFMEQIVRLKERANARIYLCFAGRQVHIAVNTGRDSFAAQKDANPRNLPMLRQRIKGEIGYIMAIVDELLQNNFLFGEEN